MNRTNHEISDSCATLKGIRGQILTFKADPFLTDNREDCYDYFSDGLVVIKNTRIVAVGEYLDVAPLYPALSDIEHYDEEFLIMPGFIDSHVHYVQSPMIGSYGDTLLHWLDKYTFPTESKFTDKDFADLTARLFFRQLLEKGTTTANVFATTFAASVNAFFEESERYNTRMISGKVLQDRNVPSMLADISAEESVCLSEQLLKKWHHRGRQLYAVVPRFAPTSTAEQLKLAGELYQKYISDGVYMHTHLDEAPDEIAWVKSLFPDARNYTDVYARFGLVDRRSVMAHCCMVEEDEWLTLSHNNCGIVTCPSSNLFLGDARFKFWEAKNPEHPCNVGVGSDVGAGTNFSILRQLGEAYKVGMLKMRPLDALRTFYMATRGGAQALHLEDTIGSIQTGYEADITVINFAPDEFLRWRMQYTSDIFEKLFVLQTVGPDNACAATYVAGKKVYDRRRQVTHLYADEI